MTDAPRVRPVIDTIPAYVPGKPATPRAGLTTYKLSSNENPNAPLPEVLEAAVAAAGRMNRYPDMACSELYAALSERLDVPTSRLAAGTGSVAVLYHLLQAFCEPGDEVVYAWRSFEAYPIAASVNGATSVQVPLLDDFRHDLDAMAGAVTDRTKVVLVCSPNNPTGPAITRTELERFLDAVPSHVVVVVDEAYREFVRSEDRFDAVELGRNRPNVAAMRTFAKAHGLAGFRVGYVVAPDPIAAAVRACSLPFGVSSVAQAAAVASLAAEPALLERVKGIVAERERVVASLTAQGWSIPDAQGNFVWLPLVDRTIEFARAAEEAGVMVRAFAGDGARVSVGEPAGNDVLLGVAAGFVS